MVSSLFLGHFFSALIFIFLTTRLLMFFYYNHWFFYFNNYFQFFPLALFRRVVLHAIFQDLLRSDVLVRVVNTSLLVVGWRLASVWVCFGNVYACFEDVCLWVVCIGVCLNVCIGEMFVFVGGCLFACLPVCLYVCMSVCVCLF